jgi:hypothetical protein
VKGERGKVKGKSQKVKAEYAKLGNITPPEIKNSS